MHQGPVKGFSLVELMVAMVVGLIVSGAAIALMISIMSANAATLRATRLTQELRVTAEIISRELRRARSTIDPVANIGLASASLLKNCNAISPATSGSTSSCATFGYDCAAKASDGTFDTGTFKAIGLANGKVWLKGGELRTAAVSCPVTSSDTQLSTDAINITDMTVCAGVFNAAGTCDGATDVYTIRLTGSLKNDPDKLTRSISQEVRIRSTEVN